MKRNIHLSAILSRRPSSVAGRLSGINEKGTRNLSFPSPTGRIIEMGGPHTLPTRSFTARGYRLLPSPDSLSPSLPGRKGRGMRKAKGIFATGSGSVVSSSGAPQAPDKPSLPVSRLESLIDSWLLYGDINQHSAATLRQRRGWMRRFAWWCEETGVADIDADAIQRFLGYLRRGHEGEKSGGARWGETSARNKVALSRPASTSTVRNYFRTLRTFLAWCANEGELAHCGHLSPMVRMNAPIHRDNQTRPFTPEQLTRILEAAKKAGSRDYCICNLLIDTGIRVSELAALTMADVDLTSSQLIIRHGKGGKMRTVGFSPDTRRILAGWIREYRPGHSLTGKGRTDGTLPNLIPLFPALRGEESGKALTSSGVNQMVTRWGKAARITGVRCSPHTFRHTFAVSFLRLGGDTFSLQTALGHTSLTMTSKYVYLAEADVNRQMARFSPVAALRRGAL